ncbi:MAG: S-layer homology domain-containing protein [Halanaerobiaceae bacterium]
MAKSRIILISMFISLLIIPIIISSAAIVQAEEPNDISNHWAQDYILSLVNRDIMKAYSDGTFRPDQPVSRGEFSIALARQLNIIPDNNEKFKDLESYPDFDLINGLVNEKIVSGYPDGTFKPDNSITRAEMVSIMIKSLGITSSEVTIKLEDHQPFKDVPETHWAKNHIKLGEQFSLINGDSNDYFYPKETATRAEAAKVLNRLDNLAASTGYLTDIYPTSGRVSINLLNGSRKIFNFDSNTLIARNNRKVELEDIMETDKVFVVSSNTDHLEYVKAYGMVTQEDLTAEVSTMTEGVFEPEEIKKLSEGNIDILKPKLQEQVRRQLKKQGLSAGEVNAIMSTDWDQLEDLSRDRLAEAIAIQSGLPLDVTRSMISGDWEKVKSYAQIEVIQKLVQEVLNSGLLS